jgi:hypothetical protein
MQKFRRREHLRFLSCNDSLRFNLSLMFCMLIVVGVKVGSMFDCFDSPTLTQSII